MEVNLTKIKRDKMLNFLHSLKETNNDDASIIAINEIENALTNKKYGLGWEEHLEGIDILLEDKLPVFTENSSLELSKGNGDENFLIEGDNLHALYLLDKIHKSNIDMIYIDPPYNTGNEDFYYDDKIVDKEDLYRHSKWLSFMERRLKYAKGLLKKDGLIFISIDDNELYQLKLLCDEIFEEKNFIANLVIETANGVFGTRASQVTKTFVKVKDYVLVYAKNKSAITRDFVPLYMGTNDLFDTHYSIMLDENLNRTNFLDYIKNDKKLSKYFDDYKLKIKLENISKLMLIDKDFNKIILDMADKIYQDVSYSLSLPDDIEERLKNGETINYKNCIIFKTKNGLGTTRQYVPFKDSLRYSDDYISEYRKTVAIGDLWEGFDADMKNVTKEGDIDFPNGKKPKRLIKQLIKWANIPDGIVLDFFAGSGTTGQSVIELNKEDGGNRKFILCTNNEIDEKTKLDYFKKKGYIDEKPAKNSRKYNEWESKYNEFVSSEEYQKIINTDEYKKLGICRGKTITRFKTLSKDTKLNLKYFEMEWLDRKPETYFLQPKLCMHVKEMIEMENFIKIDDEKYVLILNKDEFNNKLINNNKKDKIDKIWINEEIILDNEELSLLRDYDFTYIPRNYFGEELRKVGE